MKRKRLQKIVKLSDSIRQKYMDLKKGIDGTEYSMQKTFQPVVESLRTLLSEEKTKVVPRKVNLKKKIKHEAQPEKEIKSLKEEEPKKKIPKFVESEEIGEYEPDKTIEDVIEDTLQTEEGLEMIKEFLEQYGDIPKNYLTLYITGDNSIDRSSIGLKHSANMWTIGNAQVEIDKNDLIIGDKWYEGTRGLYELIFMKYPDDKVVTEKDVQNYNNILENSNAKRRHYSSKKQKQGLVTQKYKKYVAGKALKDFVHAKPNYKYWDDPNELVDRYRLLHASKAAGHNFHNNEQIAILEELREAGIIE